MQDEPPYDDVLVAPEPTPPRVYKLSGERPADTEPRGSVALAVLGEMLSMEEDSESRFGARFEQRSTVLREARDRVAAAESQR